MSAININGLINLCSVFFNGVLRVLNFVWPILVAIILFGIVIFVHEFGHFFFAKLFKIKVNEFAIGFGPTLFSKQRKETKYSIRALPLGGFCAMEGEDSESDDDNAFDKKSIWKRIVVVVAGALCNLILGFILVGGSLLIDGKTGSTEVSRFAVEDAPSYESGLRAGDEIYSINGRRTFTSSDISYMLMSSKEPMVDMMVDRGGRKTDLKVTFDMGEYEGEKYITLDFSVVAKKISLAPAYWGSNLKHMAMESLSFARIVWMSLYDLVTGRFGLNQISGPVGVVGAVSEAVSTAPSVGIKGVLYIMSLITINLGIVNLLPLPALDGGRIVLLAAQGIVRKKIPAKYEAIIHGIGFALLMAFILVVTFNDIIKLF